MGSADNRSGAGITTRRRWRALVLTIVVLATAGCGSPSKPSYGSLPSFLPTSAVQPDSILTGTADNPALTTEGDSVRVQLPAGTVIATITGPEVPGEGLPYQTPATTCTWTVTMRAATAAVPISIADFTTLDHLGIVYHPKLIAGQPKPPATLAPGKSVTFELRTVMTVGEGLIRWAPGGPKIVASWDFEVEND
jgi:hypothetical protein